MPVWSAHTHTSCSVPNNNNNTIWRGSVLTGEEPPLHSGELNHTHTQAGGPTQSQLSRPMSSRHHISMEHRQRRKHLQLNSETNASNEKLKEKQRRKKETHFLGSNKKKKDEKHEGGVTLIWTFLSHPFPVHRDPKNRIFTDGNRVRLFFRSWRPRKQYAKKKKEKKKTN